MNSIRSNRILTSTRHARLIKIRNSSDIPIPQRLVMARCFLYTNTILTEAVAQADRHHRAHMTACIAALKARRRWSLAFLRSGKKVFGPDESVWSRYRVYPNKEVCGLSDYQIAAKADALEIYSGPGQYFAGPAYIKRGRNRTLVVQRCGYDI